MKKEFELIAPAGNLEKMKIAFAFGADAVYFGVPDFSLRVRINDFNEKRLKEGVNYAHKIGKKAYVTLNIFAHNNHINKLAKHLIFLKSIKPDGIFISDPGVMTQIKKIWPKANIILSTQANCTNWQSARFWYEQGIKRVILGREVTLGEIKQIHKKNPNLELEVFVHGAMCMAYSGRCLLSKYFSSRSANLGDCLQPCRWNYSVFIQPKDKEDLLEVVEEKHGSYLLNSKDLCLIKKLPELISSGVNVFKIEGRAKSVYYLACVVGAYRLAIDLMNNKKISENVKRKKINLLYNELEKKLYNRGFYEGFMFGNGNKGQNLKDSHNKSHWEFCGQIISKNIKYKNEIKLFKQIVDPTYVKVHNTIKVSDDIEIVSPHYEIIKIKIKKIYDALTGEEISEAHGGQSKIIMLEINKKVMPYSVVRRKII